ncbi:uncharacterized protein GGS22DRAFT_162827 [Annulohypoxylon maeteangense]|uniref:uncharacterized protein n=1 Tax=Annulohypoxylon maeteangense TaxID=1927788 RepID=UPI0020084433|nr:uncharacterized protein GGS22DRAFT_162827 [Annulohypoxylon maeteangense]KAI0885122.1 hypothetical protein GGS22DRAFT_162827 [Annulohypoxylon maeteangense]
MGRLEPLTSLALGRSPYDDVVRGEGPDDIHEPEKQYDGLGRIVNPRTKQIIKDVIRAHNEVMLVIGVAEPENNGINLADSELARQHQEYESDTGRTLYQLGSSLGILNTWGILNVRRRILAYQKRADVSFFQLLQSEWRGHSFLQLLFAGYPCHMAMYGLQVTSTYFKPYAKKKYPWLFVGMEYVRFHLSVFLTMQRLDLVPGSQWLPGPSFFIPFSSTSPFSAPPLPESLDFPSILGWVGKLAAGIAPYATFYLCGHILRSAYAVIRSHIRQHLPRPTYPKGLPLSTGAIQRQAMPESPTLGAADREIRHQTLEPDVLTPLALDQPSGETIPVGSISRRGTFSSRAGDEYGTDEEDAEMVNPTLISFDVDTSESTEPQTGVWSAELRPSYPGDSRQQTKETPVYAVNPLTTLPSSFASDILANFVTNILFLPFDIHASPVVARALALRRGIPYEDMSGGSFLGGLTWRGVFNIIQLDVAKLLFTGEVWAFTTVLSQYLHVTEEEWKEIRKEDEQEGLLH